VEPSVKGSLMVGAVVSVRRLRDRGRVAPEQLEARLGAAALALIDQKIDIGRWYPVRPFCELLDVDWELGGGRDPGYMRRSGEVSADKLFERGIYQQLQYAERAGKVQTRKRLVSQTKLICTVTGTLYSFLRFEVRIDPVRPDRLEILYHDAAEFSEALRYTTEGFLNRIQARQGSSRTWSSERVGPDLVVFRVPLPARLVGSG
jgi:hypothetical protein